MPPLPWGFVSCSSLGRPTYSDLKNAPMDYGVMVVGGLFHFNYPGGTGLVSGAESSPRSQHHAAVARKIHLFHLFRFVEPPLSSAGSVIRPTDRRDHRIIQPQMFTNVKVCEHYRPQPRNPLKLHAPTPRHLNKP